MAHAFNYSTQEAQKGGSLGIEANLIYKTIFRLYGETLTQKQTNKSMIRENYTQKAKTINMEIMKLSLTLEPLMTHWISLFYNSVKCSVSMS